MLSSKNKNNTSSRFWRHSKRGNETASTLCEWHVACLLRMRNQNGPPMTMKNSYFRTKLWRNCMIKDPSRLHDWQIYLSNRLPHLAWETIAECKFMKYDLLHVAQPDLHVSNPYQSPCKRQRMMWAQGRMNLKMYINYRSAQTIIEKMSFILYFPIDDKVISQRPKIVIAHKQTSWYRH